jgi:glycosyltransferase involved in cell wall biosynthesis
MSVALLTTYLSDYRLPLFRRLAQRAEIEVLCWGGGERYAPAWFADLDAQLAAADFPARALTGGIGEVLGLGRRHDAIIAPFAGGRLLPAAYLAARRSDRPFVLWASVWRQPRSLAHGLTLPLVRRIYRDADAVIAYGEHVRRFVASIRGHDDDVVIAPQSVEPDLFRREVSPAEVAALRDRHELGDGPLVLYAGRLVAEKGIEVLARAWPRVSGPATLVVVGDGPLRPALAGLPGVRLLGPLPRAQMPVAMRAATTLLLPSIPTARFTEPWGLVVNEAMEQGTPPVVTAAVGAAAGGLVDDGQTGLVVVPGDETALAGAITQLLTDPGLRARLGAQAREAVAPYTYDAMADAFLAALALARRRRTSAPGRGRPGPSR